MNNRAENRGLDKLSVGFGVSFFVASLFNALLIITKETYAPLKDWMKSLSGHHWTTHGIFVIALFIVLGFILSKIIKLPEAFYGELHHQSLFTGVNHLNILQIFK